MAQVALRIPPGFKRDGTTYAAKGRWFTGNFVRFVGDEVVKPVGGWAYQSDADGVMQLTGVPRGSLGWEVGGGRSWQAFGTAGATKLYAFSLGTSYDITPTTELFSSDFTASDGTDINTLGWYTNGGSGYAKVYGNTCHPLTSVYARYADSQPLVDADGEVYEVYADIIKDVSGTELGIMFLVNDSGAVGEVGRFYMKYVSASLEDLKFDRFDGSYHDTVTIAQNLSIAYTEGLRMGVTIDMDAGTITCWTEPVGGGTRTDYGSQTWTAPTWFTDGNHESVGFWFQAVGSSSTGRRLDNFTVIDGAGLSASNADSSLGTGSGATYYGSGDYGDGPYGSGQPIGTITEADVWHMDNFGNILVMCQSVTNDSLYYWDPSTPSTPAALITASSGTVPTNNVGLVVTPERFLVALGANGNVRDVTWCDQEDYTAWLQDSTTQAGTYTLEGRGRIIAGARGRSETLIWTDADLHVMQYIGQPYIYSFSKKGSQCGLIAAKAHAEVNGMHVWMGMRGFFIYDGYVRSLDSEVADYVFSDMNRDQRAKIHTWVNHEFKEVWWFYPSSTATEIDRYVIWNYDHNWWATGFIDRTTAISATTSSIKPVLADSSGYVFTHETGWDHTIEQDSSLNQPYIESGPVEIGDGDQTMHIVQVIPDEATQGDVLASLYVSFYPEDTETEVGPFTVGDKQDARAHGRWARLYLQENVADDWRVGVFRIDVRPGGRR